MKLIYVVIFICFLTPVYAEFQIDNPTIPHINSKVLITGTGGGNQSFNQTLTDLLYYSITNPNNYINQTTLVELEPAWNGNYSIFLGLINNGSYLSTYNATYDATTSAWNGNSSALIGIVGNVSYLNNMTNVCYSNGSDCNTTYYPETDPIYNSIWTNTSSEVFPNRNLTVQQNLTVIGSSSMDGTTISTLTLGTDLTVPNGGTGASSFNARGVILGGTTTTGALQSIAASATNGVYFRGQGSIANPAWSSMTLPNTCAATQVAWCTSTNNFAFGTAITTMLRMISGNFVITGTAPELTLEDIGARGTNFSFVNSAGVFSLQDVSGKTIFDVVNSATDFEILTNRTCIGQSCVGSNRLIINGTTGILNGGNLSIDGLSGSLVGGFGSRFVIANNSGALRVISSLDSLVVGNFSAKIPYWTGYDNSTQNFQSTAAAQVINISNNNAFDNYGIYVQGNQNLTFDRTGDYVCFLSPEFFQNSGGTSLVTFWIQITNSTGQFNDVAWSNSRYTVPNNGYNAPTITYQFDVSSTTTRVRFMWWSDSTSTQIYSSGPLTSPTRPSIPGILLNCKWVSDLTP